MHQRTAAALLFVTTLFAVATSTAIAQPRSTDGAWTKLKDIPEGIAAGRPAVLPQAYAAFRLDPAVIRQTLASAPVEDILGTITPPPLPAPAVQSLRVQLPMPDGTFAAFDCVEASIMHPDLQARYPLIRTYRGVKVGDTATNVRFDMTPEGFHAQILGPAGSVYIDPVSQSDITHYTSYWAKDMVDAGMGSCDLHDADEHAGPEPDPVVSPAATGTTLRVYRLAVAATAEFTAAYGGTVPSGLAAVVTGVNRTTGIFELEFSIRLQLVANNDLLIYTDAVGDPYDNTNGSTMLGQNQTNVDLVIGSANYDIAHVFSTQGGGVAQLGVVCGSNKARGCSGNFGPFGSPTTTLTVAHEMGHQFNSPHSWNGLSGNCSTSQWGGSTATEPGSGSTILSYGGLCGSPENIVSGRDAYFVASCYDRITTFAASNACPTTQVTGNTPPTVNAGADFTIPANTPFTLTAVGSDADVGDTITYCWEQMDAGPQISHTAGDNGASPIIRSRPAVTSASRTIPPMTNVLAGTFPAGEILPTTSRLVKMRCTVRDNKANGGGVGQDETLLTVIGSAGPFRVTTPGSAIIWSGTRLVTWNVAGTNAAPINTANVKILLSTDGGTTFPTVLLASTPNTGSATVVLPSLTTSSARIKIESIGNIYFAVSPTNFFIQPPSTGADFDAGGSAVISDSTGNGNANSTIDPGETAIALTLPITQRRTSTATNVNATLTSLTAGVTVSSAASTYPNIATNAVATNNSPFVISVSPSFICGSPITVQVSLTSTQGSDSVQFVLATGSTAPLGSAVTFSSTSGATAIPDNNLTGISIPINVSGIGALGDIQVKFNGVTCSNNSSSTSVGLAHSQVGDLAFTLIAPTGQQIDLANAPGGHFTNTGNNLCQLNIATDATRPLIQAISGGGHFTGNLASMEDLRVLKGLPADGTWTLNIVDKRSSNTGTFYTASLIVRGGGQPLCVDPIIVTVCNPADIADDAGNPLPSAGTNTGVNEGDYNAFFQGFFTALPYCDIADDAGNAPPIGANTGVNEGDYNGFFQFFFAPCL